MLVTGDDAPQRVATSAPEEITEGREGWPPAKAVAAGVQAAEPLVPTAAKAARLEPSAAPEDTEVRRVHPVALVGPVVQAAQA